MMMILEQVGLMKMFLMMVIMVYSNIHVPPFQFCPDNNK